MTEDKIEEGDIVELADISGLPGLKKGTRGLVYHVSKDAKIIGVHWLNNDLPSIKFGYFFVYRFRKIGEDRRFKLLLAALDSGRDEADQCQSCSKLEIAKLYVKEKQQR